MASIDSIMGGGSTSSIYGSRNIISGLASGMDTEAMIENAVSGYKMKIAHLQQQRTMVEWQQSAYRSIIDKMVAFDRKYTSYSSGNNLLSGAFFDSASKIITHGTNADRISASGKTSSSIEITNVTAVAKNHRYNVGPSNMKDSNVSGAFNLTGTTTVGTMQGELTIGYGGKTVSVSFDDSDTFATAEEMAEAVNEKLKDMTISFDGGTQAKANERIEAVVEKTMVDSKEVSTIRFQAKRQEDSNLVWIDAASGSIEKALGISTSGDKKDLVSFEFKKEGMTEQKNVADLLSEKPFTMVVGGVSKTVKGPSSKEMEEKYGMNWTAEDYQEALQANIDKEFNTAADSDGRLEVRISTGADGLNTLTFTATPDRNGQEVKFAVSSGAGKTVGMANSLTSYVNTGNNLETMMPGVNWDDNKALMESGHWDTWRVAAKGEVIVSKEDPLKGTDADGNEVALYKDGDVEKWYRVDKDGNALVDFKINDKSVGMFSKNNTLKEVLDAVNNSNSSDVKVAYSEFTNTFTFTSRNGGANEKIEFGDGLAEAMFDGGRHEAGSNAELDVVVNGQSRHVSTANNTVEIDGLKITVKDEFQAPEDGKVNEPVTFTTEADADKIVGVVKDMVNDYNEMVKLIRDSYSTMPLQDSKGKTYMPLTDKDREKMSESEIKSYESRAKQGILFADRDLSSLYSGLRSALDVLGVSGNDANSLGITTSFENGATTIALDETKLRKALEQDPEKVKDVITRSKDNGASSNGLMAGIKNQLDMYANTMGANKGILIEKAGSPMAPTSIFQNDLQKKLNNFDRQINSWQSKLSDKIDYYNGKFTTLEMMIAEMNNQSGMLMGLTGGGY